MWQSRISLLYRYFIISSLGPDRTRWPAVVTAIAQLGNPEKLASQWIISASENHSLVTEGETKVLRSVCNWADWIGIRSVRRWAVEKMRTIRLGRPTCCPRWRRTRAIRSVLAQSPAWLRFVLPRCIGWCPLLYSPALSVLAPRFLRLFTCRSLLDGPSKKRNGIREMEEEVEPVSGRRSADRIFVSVCLFETLWCPRN